MARKKLRDIVVVLPGITGSVLQKDGKDLWAVSGQALWNLIKSFGRSLKQQLCLGKDDPSLDDLGDGIHATRLIAGAHLIPGLVKIDGYTTLVNAIKGNFNASPGVPTGGGDANFFEFPYDWRRDNAVAGRALKRMVDERLPQWREKSGAADAKVILVAHSMGGLVARHYLEVLEGWSECRALITFGTPYRGSINALDYLANGYKEMFIDLTEAMRTFTSVYQLLPIYPVVKADGRYVRPACVAAIPNVDQARAREALKFHRAIEAAVAAHRNDPVYFNSGYTTLPFVGIHQPTSQSAELAGGKLTVQADLPAGVDELLQDGDGTVPRLSAIPIEFSIAYRDTFLAERHAALQNNESAIIDVLARIEQMQIGGLGGIRFGPGLTPAAAAIRPAAIALEVDDVYPGANPVRIQARTVVAIDASATLVSGQSGPIPAAVRRSKEGWTLAFDCLPAGLYRLEVRAAKPGLHAPTPVHDLFAVL